MTKDAIAAAALARVPRGRARTKITSIAQIVSPADSLISTSTPANAPARQQIISDSRRPGSRCSAHTARMKTTTISPSISMVATLATISAINHPQASP